MTESSFRRGDLICIGLDDTDTIDSPGTNQLARDIARALEGVAVVEVIVRHQLFEDSRVPFTSQNGSASMLVRSARDALLADLVDVVRDRTRRFAPRGSDPGICVATHVCAEIQAFGRRCQRELVRQDEARELALRHEVCLEGLGGTEDGVIGALAAVGLLSRGDDGRVVHAEGWEWPDRLSGIRDVRELFDRGVNEIRDVSTGDRIDTGQVDLGRRLRPAYRGRNIVLFVERSSSETADRDSIAIWRALKLK